MCFYRINLLPQKLNQIFLNLETLKTLKYYSSPFYILAASLSSENEFLLETAAYAGVLTIYELGQCDIFH